ncbi:MAG: hypothetical protein AB1486_24745 [Planctomycetota bacterium]
MKQITVRNVDPELARALEKERRRGGRSLNQVVLDLLRRALGLGQGEIYSNGLRHLAGGWSQEEFEAFERIAGDFERVDEDLRR